jgi:hypothetical protein
MKIEMESELNGAKWGEPRIVSFWADLEVVLWARQSGLPRHCLISEMSDHVGKNGPATLDTLVPLPCDLRTNTWAGPSSSAEFQKHMTSHDLDYYSHFFAGCPLF